MYTPEVESQWYVALFEEDCLRIMKLLEAHPSLWKVGWKSESGREVEGSRLNHWEPRTRSPWKGRTALHVGARRGCIELIKRVLTLCNLGAGIGEYFPWMLDEQGEGTTPSITRKATVAQVHCEVVNANGTNSAGSSEDDEIVSEEEQILCEIAEAVQTTSTTGAIPGSIPGVRLHQPVPMVAMPNGKVRIEESNTNGRGRPIAAVDQKLEGEMIDLEESGEDSEIAPHDDLLEFLLLKDGEYKIDALAMAILCGNIDLVVLLLFAFGECRTESKPYFVESFTRPPRGLLGNDMAHKEKRARLRESMKKVIANFDEDPILRKFCLEEFSKHRDFNFLPREEYLLHFSFTSRFYAQVARRFGNSYVYLDKVQHSLLDSVPNELRPFLLALQDGQGRPPFHVAVDESSVLDVFEWKLKGWGDGALIALTTADGAGRTPLHRAAATGNWLNYLLEKCEEHGISAPCYTPWEHSMSAGKLAKVLSSTQDGRWYGKDFLDDDLSTQNGFRQSRNYPATPLHLAIIHRNFQTTKLLSRLARRNDIFYKWLSPDRNVVVEIDNIELMCLAGVDISFVRFLLEGGYLATRRQFSERENPEIPGFVPPPRLIVKHPRQAIHLVAASGNYDMLKLFLDDPNCDPYIEDFEGNTPLHYAMKEGHFKLEPHLLDYMSSKHILSNDSRKVKTEFLDESHIVERQGCINLLLEAGCDIFKANYKRQVPYPEGTLSKNVQFRSWWYNKHAKEFGAIQHNLNIATNAITVTATLIATASYVGPLQPPRGYTDGHEIQYENNWVVTFIFCDTLSFYLAIAAIIFSLIPSLPMPQQGMMEELQRTRAMVTLAVGILCPSIICVLIAYASSSIAVISGNITSSTSGQLTIATLFIGGPLILGGFVLFFIRLLGIWFPRNSGIRYVYKVTSFS